MTLSFEFLNNPVECTSPFSMLTISILVPSEKCRIQHLIRIQEFSKLTIPEIDNAIQCKEEGTRAIKRDDLCKVSIFQRTSCPFVDVQSNVKNERRKHPDRPCIRCKGNGKVNCRSCRGRGRTNRIHLTMLPKGEWPNWCKYCGGSGLVNCSPCLGTGESRGSGLIFGFEYLFTEDGISNKEDAENQPRH